MGDRLTLEELSRRTGEPMERLQEWQGRGVIGGPEELGPEDTGKVLLTHDLLHYGHTLAEIVEALSRPDSALRQFLRAHGQHLSRRRYTLAEASEIVGVEVGLARRIMEAAGVGEADLLDDEDLACLRACRTALNAGLPEEALIQILRVYCDAMSRAAEIGMRAAHFYVHQPLVAEQMSAEERWQRLNDTASKIEPLIQPALLYFYGKGAARASWDDVLMHLEEEAGLAEKPDTPGQIRQAVMFVDLASFTPLAEAMGDMKAAQVLQRFAEMVRMAVRRCHGRIVKQIGDGFMIVFPECHSAVSCALELEERACAEPQFPAVRSGLHWGPVLYREGDYLGSNVNIAARLAAEAQRHQVLVTEEVRRRAKGLEGAEFLHVGRRRLKGLAAEVEVFEVRATAAGAPAKSIDPVCGMELGPAEVVARLTLDGREESFCSDECLRRFVASPDQYR